MKNNKLYIQWNSNRAHYGPYSEAFFVKSLAKAQEILDRRNKESIFHAFWNNIKLI